MYCQDRNSTPLVVSDFCRLSAYAVTKIESLSREQQRALPMAQKIANNSIITKHQKDCRRKR